MNDAEQIWVVDDDQSIRWVMEKAFQREELSALTFASADDALKALKTSAPAIIFSDLRMPGTDGFTFLEKLQNDFPQIPVIIMTAHSDLDSTVTAFQTGAYEYLAKPFDIKEVTDVAKRALEQQRINTTPDESTTKTSIASKTFIGKSAAIQKVFHAIGRLSQSSISVLITGESGTGKELIAKALHEHSPRVDKEFIAINTAAIPKDLLESELFGHEKGSFTGAHSKRKGRFEQADGGTLFLDEIGDMPADLQTSLLRVLQEGQFYRVGGQAPVTVDVRIVAATHQDLLERVQNKTFRQDLYHRLNVINIHSPALRERPDDVPLLLEHFLKASAKELNAEQKTPSEAASKTLQQFAWPGNVRQLENIARWLTVMVPSQEIEINDLPEEFLEVGELPMEAGNWEEALAQYAGKRLAQGETRIMDDITPSYERIMITTALAQTGGKKQEAAELLGLGRNTLTRKIAELNITT
ncbi:MAG: Nitrogen regulation protein NR(I) [uncultured Thiotrichaceae bacterium]|uniref:DNA-binding transcriptional regulator NtrC n=1 Tax=uncultured Thiotrichaceae bacterium TaxID=298394 RepID=A0A6S6TZM9_9GAMM|nr:MAG: Nitrogen regulation protein NR(I) [uncultured Thiotrichaceae bacterium]